MALGKKTGGRVKGVPNKKTAVQREAAEQALASIETALGDRLENVKAHDVLRLVYRDRTQPIQMRMSAAATAIRYETPAMAQTAVDLNVTARRPEAWSDDQLRDFIASERAKQGLPAPGEPLTIDADCVENPPLKSTQ
jgi:hypothetical protein